MMRLVPVSILVSCLVSLPARAYVSSRSDQGTALRWSDTDCVMLQVDARGSDDIHDGSDIQAVKQAAHNWMQATGHCSYLSFVFLPDADEVTRVPRQKADGRNHIIWIEKDWSSEFEFDPDAKAITIVSFVPTPGHDNGVILDADMMFNGEFYTCMVVDPAHPPGPGNGRLTDIENVATHELGHVLGFDHPCYNPSNPPDPVPVDHLGNTISPCPQATSTMKESTMYNYADSAEIKKRTLEADDILAACETYPLRDSPGQCLDVGRRALDRRMGCSCAQGIPPTLLPALLAGLWLWLWRRRRI